MLAVLATVLAGCGGSDTPPEPTAPPAPAVPLTIAIDAGITTLPTFNPTAGHLDDDSGVTSTTRRSGSVHNRRTIEITLRSSPPGATAAVDGVVVGRTPTYWEGDFTGREREFTFVLPGHTIGRYRFVPTSSGVVHAPLVKILAPSLDGGVPVIPQPVILAPAPLPERAPPPPPKPDAAPVPKPDAAPTPPPVPQPDTGSPFEVSP